MPGAAYLVTRTVSTSECDWLPRSIERNEVVWPYYGCTYGAVTPSGVAVTVEQGVTPFYEMPADALRLVGVD